MTVFDSDTMITAALAKSRKVTLSADECRAANQGQSIIVNHDELTVQVIPTEDFESWFEASEGLGAVKPPQ